MNSMKKITLLLLTLLFISCGVSNRYLLTDTNNNKNFLKQYIDSLNKADVFQSTKPMVVFDGVPRRYDIELKENAIEYSKSEIKNIFYLKNEVGIRIYGEWANNGVLVVQTIYDTTENKKKDKKEDNNNDDVLIPDNIYVSYDDKKVESGFIRSINPDDIYNLEVIKDSILLKESFTNKDYIGMIKIKSYDFVQNEYRKNLSEISSDYKKLIRTISIENEYEEINYILNDTLLIPKNNHINKLLDLERFEINTVDVTINKSEKHKVVITTN